MGKLCSYLAEGSLGIPISDLCVGKDITDN